jgi:O-antigen/teichoic acid export membrane protein
MTEPVETTVPVGSPPRHLAFGTVLAAGAQVAPLVASAGISLTIARAYGPSATGVISLVMNFVAIVTLIGGIGLAAGITYQVSRGEWPLRQAAVSMLQAASALGIVSAVLGIAFYFVPPRLSRWRRSRSLFGCHSRLPRCLGGTATSHTPCC